MKTRQAKYLQGLGAKGLKKACYVIPEDSEQRIKNFIDRLRTKHLRGLKNEKEV